jgi:glycosyltransferase involved in cell wall biosynthesis
MRTNLHISLTDIRTESRLFKESESLIANDIFDRIVVVGLHEDGLKRREPLGDSEKIVLERVALSSRRLPRLLPFQIVKYLEFLYRIIREYGAKRFDTVTIHTLALLPVGVAIKRLFGSRLIYDAHEYETERHQLVGIRKRLAKWTERMMIGQCDRLIVVSDSIADEYKKLYPVIERPLVVLNAPFLSDPVSGDLFRKELGIGKSDTIFLYQGALDRGRGIEIILEAFAHICESRNGSSGPVIVFMGRGEYEKKIIEHSKRYDNIFFREAVSPDILLEYTASADFGISLIEPISLSYQYCLPNKLFEYLMARIPILVTDLPEMGRLVRENGLGVTIEENSAEALSRAVEEAMKLDRSVVKKRLDRVRSIYCWENQEPVLLQAYRKG